MDNYITDIKYISDNTQNVPDDINFNKPNLEVMCNDSGILLYYDKGNKLQTRTEITSIDIDLQQSLINSMVKFNLEQPYADANKRPLTYIEMVQYAILNSNQSNILDRTSFDKNQGYLLNQSQCYNKDNKTTKNIIKYYEKLNESKKDFIILPVITGPKREQHAINQILYFKDKNPKDISIYTFDSANNDNGKRDNQLCKQNLQGDSETCTYWATNFAILASQYENFESLQKAINDGLFIEDLKKVTSLLVDRGKTYLEVCDNYKNYEVDENSLSTGKLRKIEIIDIKDPKFIDRSEAKGFGICKSFCKCSTISKEINVEEIETLVQNHAETVDRKSGEININYIIH